MRDSIAYPRVSASPIGTGMVLFLKGFDYVNSLESSRVEWACVCLEHA